MNLSELKAKAIAHFKAKGESTGWIQIAGAELINEALASGEAPTLSMATAPTIVATYPAPTPITPVVPTSSATPAPSPDALADLLADALRGRIEPSASTMPAPLDEDRVVELIEESVRHLPVATPAMDEEKVKEFIVCQLTSLAESAPKTFTSAMLTLTGATSGGGSTPAETALLRWANSTQPVRPVLLVGPAGSGKSVACRTHGEGEGFDAFYEYQCSPDDERSDLLGKDIPVPSESGSFGFAWSDSAITSAFREASEGKKVCLLVDEFYSLTKQTRRSLLSALAPTLDGHYVLQTGRTLEVVDGVARIETIKAKTNMLAIVATTNAGIAYGLDESDPAEAERWERTFCPTDWDFAKDLLKQACEKIGWEYPTVVADKLVQFGRATENLKDSCELWHSASLRTLMHCVCDSEPNNIASLSEALALKGNVWTAKDADGKPVQAQVDGLKNVIRATFS